ncbi:unnamed protein product [Sympodiomycopsis kandeliae]
MSFHTPQAQVSERVQGSSSYFPGQQPSSANASATPRSSSMRNVYAPSASTPKNVRWPDEQNQQQLVNSSQRSNTPSSTSNMIGPLTPAKTTSLTPAISSGIRSVTSSLSKTAGSGSSNRNPTPQQSTPSSTPAASSSSAGLPPSPSVVRASAGALRSRMKWNAGAWLILVVAPNFEITQKVYWSLADVAAVILGTSAYSQMEAATTWIRWASLLLFTINFLEAVIQLRFSSTQVKQSRTQSIGLSQPPGSAPRPSSQQKPQTTPSRSTPSHLQTRYSPNSPLKSSLEAASRLSSNSRQRSISGQGSSPFNSSASSPQQGRRLPSAPPASFGSSSPLAAYLARRAPSQGDRSFQSNGDTSFGDVGDTSTDSVEVDRALRALSNSFVRSSSLSRTRNDDDEQDQSKGDISSSLTATPTPVYAGR